MTPVWRQEALEERDAILSYIATRNVAAAAKLDGDIEACIARLTMHPRIYRSGRVEGTREAVVRANYILVYRVAGKTLEIISVVHSRRDYP